MTADPTVYLKYVQISVGATDHLVGATRGLCLEGGFRIP